MGITVKIAGLGKEFKEGGFKKAFDELPHGRIIQYRDEICQLCYWSVSTFKYKINGKVSFRIFEIQQIENFFQGKNLNAWTGEKLN
jgi:hypothetical protein